MNFIDDIREYIQREFDFLNIKYNPSADINKDLLDLLTLHEKYVFEFPRDVELSKELTLKISNPAYKYTGAINHLRLLFINGSNVNPFQSSKLFNYRVHDDLVYSWSIYHFHLSTKRTTDPFFNDRTKEVLFVYISNKEALFLDTNTHPPHEVFADKRLLEILDNNWDAKLLQLKDVVGLSRKFDNKERFNLRKHQVNEGALEVNGKFVYPPGLGITASGHSASVSMKINEFNRWLKRNEKKITDNRIAIDAFFSKTHNLTGDIQYKLLFTENGPQIWDKNSGTPLVKYFEIIN